MDEQNQIKRLLKKNLEISQKSLEVLNKMRKAQVVGRVFKAFKWLVILSLAFGTYYYVQPYMANFWGTINDILHSLSLLDESQTIMGR